MSQPVDKSAQEIQSLISNNMVCLIDVREEDEFAHERIPNTHMHLPLSRFNPEEIPTNSDKKLTFICSQGIRSQQVGQYLLDNKFIKEAYNLKDGLLGWRDAGFPIESG